MRQFGTTSILLGLCAWLQIIPLESIAEDAPQLVLPIGHTRAVTSVAFSPDGRYVISGSADTTVKLWEAATGREVRCFSGHTHGVYSVAFSPDGRYIISGSAAGRASALPVGKNLRLWEVSSGQEILALSGPKGVYSVAFSPDGHYALSGSYRSMNLWMIPSGREYQSFSGHTHAVTSVAFSPDGRYVLSGSYDKTMKLWHVASGKEERSFSVRGHKSPVRSAAFSPDGRYILANLDDKTLRLWSVSTGREVRSFSGRTGVIYSVAFSPDGQFALAGCGDGSLRLWDVFSGRRVCSFHHGGSVLSVAYSPDGRYVISGSDDGTLKLWDMSIGREVRSFSGHTSHVTSVAFSPDGRYALSGSTDNILRLWNMLTGRTTRCFSGHKGEITSVTFSPDGRYAVSGSYDKTAKLWDVSTGKEICSFSGYLSGHRGPVTSVAFSPDGHYVISGSHDKTLKLWTVPSGRNVRTFSGHTGKIFSVTFSPDGCYVLSGSDDKAIKLWEISTGQAIRTFAGDTDGIISLAFSPDGRYAVAGSYDGKLKLWDVSTGREVRSFSGQAGWIRSVAFSPDGRYTMSAGDWRLNLWDVSTGQKVRSFSGHGLWIYSVAFSPDGRYALSGGSDGAVKLWEVATGKLLLTRLHLDEADWVVVTPDGRFDGSSDGIDLLHYAKSNRSIALDALFDRFYTPNLVGHVLSGEELAPDEPDIRKGIEVPPLVGILSPEEGKTLRERTVDVVVEAVDQGGGVEDIRLYHNGKQIIEEKRGMKVREQLPARVQRTFTVSLVNTESEGGMNTLRATAFSRDRTEAHPFEVAIKVEIAKATADLYIVAVGINSYKNPRYKLNCSVPDAQAVVACLRKRGDKIFRNILIQTILDEAATRSGIEAALKQVQQEARPEDVFVFYYAGHGVMSEGSPGHPADFYLVPTDVTKIYGDGTILAEMAIPSLRLRYMCQWIRARKQLLILDACQSGAMVKKLAVRGMAEEKAIAQLARSAGVVVLASAESEQLASEAKELGHGLFTYTLLQGMEGKADGSPKDGKVTVNELSGYVQDQIPELTERYRGEPQYPMVYIYGQDFPLVIR